MSDAGTHELQELAQRVTRLERASRRWQAAAGLAALGCIGLLGAGAAPKPPAELTVQRLVVKSPSGDAAVRIEPGTVEVLGGVDKARVAIVTNLSPVDGAAAIELSRGDELARLSPGALALRGPDITTSPGEKAVELWLEARARGLQLYVAREEAGVQITNRKGHSSVRVGQTGNTVQLAAGASAAAAAVTVESQGTSTRIPPSPTRQTGPVR